MREGGKGEEGEKTMRATCAFVVGCLLGCQGGKNRADKVCVRARPPHSQCMCSWEVEGLFVKLRSTREKVGEKQSFSNMSMGKCTEVVGTGGLVWEERRVLLWKVEEHGKNKTFSTSFFSCLSTQQPSSEGRREEVGSSPVSFSFLSCEAIITPSPPPSHSPSSPPSIPSLGKTEGEEEENQAIPSSLLSLLQQFGNLLSFSLFPSLGVGGGLNCSCSHCRQRREERGTGVRRKRGEGGRLFSLIHLAGEGMEGGREKEEEEEEQAFIEEEEEEHRRPPFLGSHSATHCIVTTHGRRGGKGRGEQGEGQIPPPLCYSNTRGGGILLRKSWGGEEEEEDDEDGGGGERGGGVIARSKRRGGERKRSRDRHFLLLFPPSPATRPFSLLLVFFPPPSLCSSLPAISLLLVRLKPAISRRKREEKRVEISPPSFPP